MKMYFTLDELCVTDTGLSNIPDVDDVLLNFRLQTLKVTLNVIRGIIGIPIKVTSGFRTAEVNCAVDGSKNSYHLYGRAADITCSKLHELLEICMKLYESGVLVECIYYPDKNFIHIAI